jgi:hypothetical protein
MMSRQAASLPVPFPALRRRARCIEPTPTIMEPVAA